MNCPRCGKNWMHGDCESTPARRARCANVCAEVVGGALKTARERLCKAQMLVPDHWRETLGWAVHLIDEVGSATYSQWSKHDQPEYPEAKP